MDTDSVPLVSESSCVPLPAPWNNHLDVATHKGPEGRSESVAARWRVLAIAPARHFFVAVSEGMGQSRVPPHSHPWSHDAQLA